MKFSRIDRESHSAAIYSNLALMNFNSSSIGLAYSGAECRERHATHKQERAELREKESVAILARTEAGFTPVLEPLFARCPWPNRSRLRMREPCYPTSTSL